MPIWDQYLTEQDKAAYAKAGWGATAGWGRRPAVLVVDVNYNFCGEERLPLLESIEKWRNCCGPQAWDAIPRIAQLLEAARAQHLPVFYSTGLRSGTSDFDRGRWIDKNSRGTEDRAKPKGREIVKEIEPLPHEIVIYKPKPSVFFASALTGYLTDLGADSVIVCGTATSGCIRATVLDAFSLNFRVSVVEECTFDRGEVSHAINLFDMHQKYADVVSLDDTLTYIKGLPDDLFIERMPVLANPS